MPIVRDMLRSADRRLRLCDIRRLVLTSGVMCEAAEISSCLSKLLDRKEVDRLPVQGVGRGRREVWGYLWIGAKG